MTETELRKFGELEPEAAEYISKAGMLPRYNFWAKMPHWSVEEAITLSLNIEPSAVDRTDLPRRIMILIAKEYKEVGELLRRSIDGYELYPPIRPKNYLDWARRHDVNFPIELEKLLPRPITKLSEIKKEEPPASSEKLLGTRERETLLKLIIGMAIKGYGYNPKAKKNESIKEIQDDLITLDMLISDDSIRQKLKEASELLPSIGGDHEF